MSVRETRLCRLEESLGREEMCPEERCPFWSSGEEPRQGHCSLDGLDLDGREQFAEWLHGIRRDLTNGDDAARHEFFQRLNEGRSD